MLGNTNSNGLNPAKLTRLGGVWSGEDNNGDFQLWTINPQDVYTEETPTSQGTIIDITTLNYTIQQSSQLGDTIIIGE